MWYYTSDLNLLKQVLSAHILGQFAEKQHGFTFLTTLYTNLWKTNYFICLIFCCHHIILCETCKFVF